MGISPFCLTCLTIIFSNLAVTAESYTEPPILHKEIELKQQSEAKKAREEAAYQAAREAEQKRMAEEQKRMAEKREKLQESREAEEKRIANERAKKQAELEAELKRIAEQEAEKKRTQEEKRTIQRIIHPACVGKDNDLCDTVKVALVLKGKLCYRVMNIIRLDNDNFNITCELARFDPSLVEYLLFW